MEAWNFGIHLVSLDFVSWHCAIELACKRTFVGTAQKKKQLDGPHDAIRRILFHVLPLFRFFSLLDAYFDSSYRQNIAYKSHKCIGKLPLHSHTHRTHSFEQAIVCRICQHVRCERKSRNEIRKTCTLYIVRWTGEWRITNDLCNPFHNFAACMAPDNIHRHHYMDASRVAHEHWTFYIRCRFFLSVPLTHTHTTHSCASCRLWTHSIGLYAIRGNDSTFVHLCGCENEREYACSLYPNTYIHEHVYDAG